MPRQRPHDVEGEAPRTKRETLGNMLKDIRGLMAERQPSQVPMDRRPSTIRAATGGERVGAYVQSLLGLLAKQPVGRVTDAFGMTGLDAMANRPAPSTTIAMMPDLPGRKMAQLLEGETARALTGGFYSRVDEAAKLLPSKGVKAESLINTLKKASGGVSAEELELRGLAEFAASKRGQTVTPADLAAHLEANPAPFPTVKTLGGPSLKFSQYQVPGGENYRQTLLTLPKGGNALSEAENQRFNYLQHRRTSGAFDMMRGPLKDELQALKDKLNPPAEFRSSHFNDPNIVAHTRSNERTSPTGERGTFLEEVQSDWHQAGKTHGYKRDAREVFDRIKADVERKHGSSLIGLRQIRGSNADPVIAADLARVDEAYATLQREIQARAVPDAPFKENWPDLSLKQALIDEANRSPDPGFLGFTGGKTQAARYDLSKQVGKVEADLYDMAGDNNWRLKAWDINGNQLPISNQYLTDTELADHIGKDMARKIIADEGGVYTGLDLQVGGEGMHEFYDKLLPKRLEKIVKPFGGTVEETGLGWVNGFPESRSRSLPDIDENGSFLEPAWYARLTPEMKARILKEGLPLMGLSGLTLGNLLGQEQEPVR